MRRFPSAGRINVTVVGLLAVSLTITGSVTGSSPQHRRAGGTSAAGTGFTPLLHLVSRHGFATPPTTAQCKSGLGRACYSPRQFQTAYDMHPLYSKGFKGQGRTIVIVDSFGSPTIRRQLRVFDEAFGLPAPPRFRIIQPVGDVPPFDPNNGDMVGWAQETSLDVEYAHAMAPRANILLVETPVAETLGTHGFPKMIQAENYVIRHGLGAVISQSFGATEATFPNRRAVLRLRTAFQRAATHHVTVLAASGDAGATDAKTVNSSGFASSYYTHRVNSWPSSDPLVTSVGGTQLHLDASGDRVAPDNVWNDVKKFHRPAAGGGGRSHIFARPPFQNGVAGRVGSHRGTPDVAMSAADDGAALVYLSARVSGGSAGFFLIAGTSLATPLFAGVVAVADQYAGARLGFLNRALYRMRAHPVRNGLVDVRRGNNTVSFRQDGQSYTVPGFRAVSGFDMASGVGTVDGARFVPALARALG